MSLITVVRDVCAVVGVLQPVSVMAAIGSNRTMSEMLALANEMAQRIAYDTRDWTELQTATYFVGDGVVNPVTKMMEGTTHFQLPANYKRMPLTGSVWRSTAPRTPMVFVSDWNEWIPRRLNNEVDGRGEWTISGGQILIYPIMAGFIPAVPEDPGPPWIPAKPAVPAVTALLPYIDKNCIALASGGVGDRFQADADRFRLDERILKLGMIWQWKANKGSPYAEDMGTYTDAIANVTGHNKPSPIIVGSSYAYRS